MDRGRLLAAAALALVIVALAEPTASAQSGATNLTIDVVDPPPTSITASASARRAPTTRRSERRLVITLAGAGADATRVINVRNSTPGLHALGHQRGSRKGAAELIEVAGAASNRIRTITLVAVPS